MTLCWSLTASVAIAVLLPVGTSAAISFSVVSEASRGCLDIQGNTEKDGTKVSTSKCDSGEPKDSQVWLFRENQLVHRAASGQEFCLDIPEDNRANGQKLQVWTCSESETQQFMFEDGEFKTVDGAMCLDLSAEDGRTVQLWQCDGFSANQRWIMRRVAAPTITASVSIKDSKCLDLTNEESGTAVQVRDCDAKSPDAGQTWILRDLSIVHRSASGTELCLDIPENDHSNGQQLQVWSCNGSEQQKFLNENGQFKTLDGEKCLDLREEDETAVQLYDCLDTENQQWVVTRLHGDKTTTLSPSPTTDAVSLSTAVFHCLDLTDGVEADGTLLQVGECDPMHPDADQVWYLEDGQVMHRSASGDALCLDVPSTDEPADGVQLQVWSCSGAVNQQWQFEDGVIKTADGEHCVDLSTEGDAVVQLWSCLQGAANQQWVLTELKPSPSPGPKPTSTAAPVSSESFSVVSQASLACLDLSSNKDPHHPIQVLDCDPHHPDAAQVWSFEEDHLVHHSSNGDDLCLDIPDDDRSDGKRLQVWACTDAESQKFVYDVEAGSIRTLDGSTCLDLCDEDGVTVQLWECAHSKNQQWILTKVSSTTTLSKSTTSSVKTSAPTTTATAPPLTTHSPKPRPTTTDAPKPKGKRVSISSGVWFGCVDLAGDDSEGTLVEATACNPDKPSASQTWTLAGDQLFHESSGSALCLDVPKMDDGQQLQLSSCDGSKRQRFSFENGELRTKKGEKCVDLKDSDTKTMQLLECDDSVNQEWVVTEVATSLEAAFARPTFFV